MNQPGPRGSPRLPAAGGLSFGSCRNPRRRSERQARWVSATGWRVGLCVVRRLELTDQAWAVIGPLRAPSRDGASGAGSPPGGQRHPVEAVHRGHGGICPNATARGTRSANASAAGRPTARGNGCRPMSSSTAMLSGRSTGVWCAWTPRPCGSPTTSDQRLPEAWRKLLPARSHRLPPPQPGRTRLQQTQAPQSPGHPLRQGSRHYQAMVTTDCLQLWPLILRTRPMSAGSVPVRWPAPAG